MDIETKNKLDEIQAAFCAKSQMDQLNAYLDKCEDFKNLRDKMCEEYSENCYGPGMSDFTISAVIRIIEGWESGEESVLSKENKKLLEENSNLKKKIQKVDSAQDTLSRAMLRLVRMIWMSRDSFAPDFKESIKDIIKTE